MHLYVWKRLDNVTSRYHSKAGVLIIADGQIHAEELFDEVQAKRLCKNVITGGGLFNYTPDIIAEVYDVEPQVVIFPDSGCC